MKVKIINWETGETIKEVACETLKQAKKVEDGININLNHNEYYTEIEL